MTSDSPPPLTYVLGPLQRLDAVRPWWQRWAFGCLFAYLVLYNLPFPLRQVYWHDDHRQPEQVAEVVQNFTRGKNDVVGWFGTEVLRLDEKPVTQISGSGDQRIHYLQAATYAALAIAFGLLFLLLDWRGRSIRFLHAMLRIYVRYALAAVLLSYGFAKVFPLQFGELTGERLYGTYGQASPMNLLWTFLAGSPAYTIVSGGLEALAGLLLFFRRTTTLGALLALVVLCNIALLNYCYDVPVKLSSSHLLLMALVLLAPAAPRLWAVLVSHRATDAVRLRRPLPLWWFVLLQIAKFALIGLLLRNDFRENRARWLLRDAPPSPLHGIWEVFEFSLTAADGKDAPPRQHWHHLTVSRGRPQAPPIATIGLLGYSKRTGTLMLDETGHTLTISSPNRDSGPPLQLGYERRTVAATDQAPAIEQLVLTGQVEGGTLHTVLHKREPESFPIHAHRFEWIQAFPRNSNR